MAGVTVVSVSPGFAVSVSLSEWVRLVLARFCDGAARIFN